MYKVKKLPKAGETLSAISVNKFLGGKGVNQSIAIARAGGELRHIGAVGPDGGWALSQMLENDVAVDFIVEAAESTGHAIIYVDAQAENQIVIYGGANQAITKDQVTTSLDNTSGWVLFQNEMNMSVEIALIAKQKHLKLAYSAAPFSKEKVLPLLDQIDFLVVNELEAQDLANATGCKIEDIDVDMFLVTKGASGADLWHRNEKYHQPSFNVDAVDTTGAGDTFLGSFLAIYDQTTDVKLALRYAAAASAIQVTRLGAATAIPTSKEVNTFLEDYK